MKITNGLLFLAIMLLANGCTKKREVVPLTKTQLLTQKNWFPVALRTEQTGGTWVNYTIPPCDKDNILKFDSDGVYHFDEGATKCNQSNKQASDSRWRFQDFDTAIVFSDISGKDFFTYFVLQLDENTLKVNYYTGPYNNEITFSH